MYPSFQNNVLFVLIPTLVVVATQLLLIRRVSSLKMTNAYLDHKCSANQGKYKPGSYYEKIFDSAIQELSKNTEAFRGGSIYMDYTDLQEIRSDPERIYFTFQCRGDIYGPQCRSCFATAQSELIKRCPRDKGAIIWYDHCLFQFSSIGTAGGINYDDSVCYNTARARPNAKSHISDSVFKFLTLLDNLTSIAVIKRNKFFKNVDQPALFAAGEKTFGNKKLYVMVQCTRDLNAKACEECMAYNIKHFEDCYENKPVGLKSGARVLGRSCNFRFERYPFVNPKTSSIYLKF
ncbi:PREDICTED: putative cysteine-rich repeat secretory protein 14 isoform X1 [Camelina sativa]|uniref:Cysteine-rich repeat secretory protein 14 isoform X1 n=1 Tax=Camelina sativa TaxID=90675 RepID=A0ABM1RT88_CAMSA|nr:PREDICTED: putative cysteine-rich repeat secretory protein 14 isoform X1 [Camelina sativa]